jgi:hypothetical protein
MPLGGAATFQTCRPYLPGGGVTTPRSIRRVFVVKLRYTSAVRWPRLAVDAEVEVVRGFNAVTRFPIDSVRPPL